MEEFRKKAKTASKIYIAVLIAAVLLTVVFKVMEHNDTRDEYTLSSGFGSGFCAGMIFFAALKTAEYSSALKDDEKLKKLYIRETDERERLIFEKSRSSSSRMFMVTMGLSAIPASYFSEAVFYTLLSGIAVLALMQTAFDFYYRRKY